MSKKERREAIEKMLLIESGSRGERHGAFDHAVITDTFAVFSSMAIVLGRMKDHIKSKYGDVKRPGFELNITLPNGKILYRHKYKSYVIVTEAFEIPLNAKNIVQRLDWTENDLSILINREAKI